jgi:putative CocE/NonD family hydrolase
MFLERAAPTTGDEDGHQTATFPAALRDVQLQWGLRIPLRDGIALNATAYLPRGRSEPGPAIFTLTPYIGQSWHAQAMYFAAHGYPFLSVDVRGRGNSEGTFRPLINEAEDAYDVVEWIAQQPFCNGKVAMWGGSYSGHTQWAAARKLPAHLATIVPVASPYLSVDFPIRNNIAKPYLMKWLTLVWGRAAQERLFWNNEHFWSARFRQWFESGAPFRNLDSQLGMPSPVFQEWLSHPEQDEYWDRYNPTQEEYAKISIPVLTITGSYDGDQLGALKHYREHLKHAPAEVAASHYLVIGPWDHAGTREPKQEFCGLRVGSESMVDLDRLHAQWYAWTMERGSRPEFLRKQVAYYVMGAERWRYADSLDAITARSETLYLQSTGNPNDVFCSGLLGHEPPPQCAAGWYRYDPRDTQLAAIESTVDPESRVDDRMIHASAGRHLIYHSPPFSADTEISGFFRLIVWLGIDRPDTDFRASVYEVGLGSNSVLLTSQSIRARYRESLRQPKLVSTTEPLRYDFDGFMFISRQIKRGHRLRLVIGPVNSIYMQKNYNAGGVVAAESVADACPVTVRLFHDAQYPSALYVPMASPEC